MYRVGQEIEYANGFLATVVAVPSEGTPCACGGFVIQTTRDGFALCWMDLETDDDEEVWGFHDEDMPFVPTLEEALAQYRLGGA
jgi:hypothetical protein